MRGCRQGHWQLLGVWGAPGVLPALSSQPKAHSKHITSQVPAQRLRVALASSLLQHSQGANLTSAAGSTTLVFLSPVLPLGCLDGVFWRKSEILCTKKSRSFRLANRKVILLLVLMDRGLGKTLELSAFSTMVT